MQLQKGETGRFSNGRETQVQNNCSRGELGSTGKQTRRSFKDLNPEFKTTCPFFGVPRKEVDQWTPGSKLDPSEFLPEG